MIERIFIPVVLAIVLSYLYVDLHYWRHRQGYCWWKRVLWWAPAVVMLVYTAGLASVHNFVPDNLTWVNVYLILLGFVVYPNVIFCLFSLLGRAIRRCFHTRRNWGIPAAALFVPVTWLMMVYGCIIGVRQLEVRRIELSFKDLPPAFDGYRIVHFSDAHVGTFTGSLRKVLARDIDSINAQKPDLIAFTGDLQNLQPCEIRPVMPLLSRLHAVDGVFSVLGNHDYAEYVKLPPNQELRNIRETRMLEKRCGWHLLLNSSFTIRRGRDSLVIAGEQNLERPDSACFTQAMRGVGAGVFAIVLQHNPKAWAKYIVKDARARLTLCGHTHGGQLSLFGLRPTQVEYRQDYGLYRMADRYLYVSAGLGGLIPFRFGVSPEIVVITLHKSKS